MVQDVEVPSIRDRDLRNVLRHFGLEDALDRSEIECASCSRDITWENLGAMRVEQGKIILYCDFSECLESAARSVE